MLTRGRKARGAGRPEAAHEALAPLPLPCVLDILSRLAPGERLLSSALSRAWRAAVHQPSLWASVDLTRAASPHNVSNALLAAVVTKAAGRITSLQLCLCVGGVTYAAVLAAVNANAGALRWLGVRGMPLNASKYFVEGLSRHEVAGLLLAARGLLSFDVDVKCTFQSALALLAGQGQYNGVRIRRLDVWESSGGEAIRLARALRLSPSIQELGIRSTQLDTSAALGALVDAVIACGLTGLWFYNCVLGPQSAAHLARLLRDAPRLTTLLISFDGTLFDVDSVSVLAAALRVSSLIVLGLEGVGLWLHEGVGNVVVDALLATRRFRNCRWRTMRLTSTIHRTPWALAWPDLWQQTVRACTRFLWRAAMQATTSCTLFLLH